MSIDVAENELQTTLDGGFGFPELDAGTAEGEVTNFQQSEDNTTIAVKEVIAVPVMEAGKGADEKGVVQTEECSTNSGEISLNPRQKRFSARQLQTRIAEHPTGEVSIIFYNIYNSGYCYLFWQFVTCNGCMTYKVNVRSARSKHKP